MPETNIVVQFVSDLLDRAKGLMEQNRASLNVNQQEKKTQEKADEAVKGPQREGRPKRQLRTILRPTAIGGGFPVAMGFFLPGATTTVDPNVDIPRRRYAFTITSGNGEVVVSSFLEYDNDPVFAATTVISNSNPALQTFYFQNANNDPNDDAYQLLFGTGGPPVASWNNVTSYKEPRGATGSSGTEVICLPVDGQTFVMVVVMRRVVSADTAQYKRINTYVYQVANIGGDLYRIGPLSPGTGIPIPTTVETTTSFPSGRVVDAKAFLVSYESVRLVPVPSGLLTIMQNSTPAAVGGTFVDYPGFTASSYGMNEDWLEVNMADGFELATGTNNDYFTGGIYPVLQRDPDEWRDVMDDPSVEDPYTLEGAADFLSTSFNPRAYLFSCINVGTCEPGRIGHDKASSPTATTFTPNRPEGTTITTWLPDGSTAMHVWDGGLAGYCRGKLIELGFTDADLTP